MVNKALQVSFGSVLFALVGSIALTWNSTVASIPEISELTRISPSVSRAAIVSIVEAPAKIEQHQPAPASAPEPYEQFAGRAETTVSAALIDPAKQESRANKLKAATLAASDLVSLGPISSCMEQIRAFACPIVSNIPVVKDIASAVTLELGISCPTSFGT